jgi:hypothetical protein
LTQKGFNISLFDTFENFIHDFHNEFTEVELGNGIKAMIPKDMTDVSIRYQYFMAQIILHFKAIYNAQISRMKK